MVRFFMLRLVSFALMLGCTGVGVATAQSTTRISVSSSGLPGSDVSSTPRVSDDGRFVVFITNADNLVAGGASGSLQTYVHDRVTGVTELVSANPAGLPGNSHSFADGHANVSSLHCDLVTFSSLASDLVPGDTNVSSDVFVRNRISNTTTLVSTNAAGQQGNSYSDFASISIDGNFVAFESLASNLVPFDTGQKQDVFVKNLATGAVELVSKTYLNNFPNGDSGSPAISNDGRWVAYASDATSIVQFDQNGARDIFVRDRLNGTTERISVNSAGNEGNASSDEPYISTDGMRIAFQSHASNLVANDTNGFLDVFLRDRVLATTVRVSVGSSGTQANGASYPTSISARGRYIAFYSAASNLFAADTNNMSDAFRYDLYTGVLDVLSVSSTGVLGDDFSEVPSLSAAGDVVAYSSNATNLIAGDTNGTRDVFVRDLLSTATPITSYCTAKANSNGCVSSIGSSGLASASNTDAFRLCAGNVTPFVTGLFFFGKTAAAAPFHGGTLCLAAPLSRSPALNIGTNQGGCGGAIGFALTSSLLASRGFISGDTGYAQFWFRDPGFAFPDDMAMTDALSFTVEP